MLERKQEEYTVMVVGAGRGPLVKVMYYITAVSSYADMYL